MLSWPVDAPIAYSPGSRPKRRYAPRSSVVDVCALGLSASSGRAGSRRAANTLRPCIGTPNASMIVPVSTAPFGSAIVSPSTRWPAATATAVPD